MARIARPSRDRSFAWALLATLAVPALARAQYPACVPVTAATLTMAPLAFHHRVLVAGQMTLPFPFVPPLDPSVSGVAVQLFDGTGTLIQRIDLFGNPFGPWFTVSTPKGTRWATPGLFQAQTFTASPGVVKFRMRSSCGYCRPPLALPLRAVFVFSRDPSPGGAQCGEMTFPGPAPGPSCTVRSSGKIYCR